MHAILKTTTGPIHVRVEKSAFFNALLKGELPKKSAATYVRCLAIVHEVLEHALATSTHPDIQILWGQQRPKVPLLSKDIAALDLVPLESVGTAILRAVELGALIKKDSCDPIRLLGYLYVLEGSQNGAAALKRHFAKSLNLDPETLSYFGCYGTKTVENWKRFVDAVKSISTLHSDAGAAARSAVSCFEGLERITSALYPV